MSREKSIKTININLEKLTALELEEVTVLTNALLAVRNVREEHQAKISGYTEEIQRLEYKAKEFQESAELTAQEVHKLRDANKQLKSQLEKQQPEIPEVPQFVAEYIERCKRSDCGLIWAVRPDRDANENSEKIYDWLYPNGVRLSDGTFPEPFEPDNLVRPDKENHIKFAQAWLNGYTVAKEKRYEVVFLEDDTTRQILMENNAGYYFIEEESENYGYWKQDFTEMEIKEINEKFWQLSVPVKDEQIEV